MNMLGRVANVEMLDDATQAHIKVPKSVVVWFAMYDFRRDPVKVLNLSIHLQAVLITRRTSATTTTGGWVRSCCLHGASRRFGDGDGGHR